MVRTYLLLALPGVFTLSSRYFRVLVRHRHVPLPIVFVIAALCRQQPFIAAGVDVRFIHDQQYPLYFHLAITELLLLPPCICRL